MAEQKETVLNRLVNRLPPGLLADTKWLQGNGLSRSLIHDYVQRGLLERVGPRLYRRTGSDTSHKTRWEVAILSAQQLSGATVHIGGPTALGLLGKSHYLHLSREHRVYLYDPDHMAPTWLGKLELDATLIRRTRSSFTDKNIDLEWRRIDLGTGRLGLQAVEPQIIEPWDHFLRVAGEARAALEMIDEVPETVSFEHADTIFQSLTNLRPQLVTILLQMCRSVKAKRLFLLYADRHAHAWVSRIDKSKVDLGKGKRQLLAGGKMHPLYQITVPAALLQPDSVG